MSKDLRVDVGLDAKLANYNLISLEKISNYFEKIEKENEEYKRNKFATTNILQYYVWISRSNFQ